MPRFVILRHEPSSPAGRPLHWDLMLEESGSLLSWALPAIPVLHETIPAERLPDHRLAYLDYEGPVAGDRGVVSRWDAGSYERLDAGEEEVRVRLHGANLSGILLLQRMAHPAGQWQATFLLEPGTQVAPRG